MFNTFYNGAIGYVLSLFVHPIKGVAVITICKDFQTHQKSLMADMLCTGTFCAKHRQPCHEWLRACFFGTIHGSGTRVGEAKRPGPNVFLM